MTNREKWAPKVNYDNAIEYTICKIFATPTIDEACPGCPLRSLCRSYVNEGTSFEQYMEKVSEWLDKEAVE